jgi:large subunit ribosomal protein L5
MNRLREKYIKVLAPKMSKDLGLENVMSLPKIQKISINSGIGSFRENREAVDSFQEELSALAGQKAYPRKARKSEAGFKIRQNDVVGFSVTLRGERMWAFLDKLISIAIPRVRDFRGLEDTSFDGNGNYSIGVREHVIFPEVNPNTTKGIRSLQVTIVFNTRDTETNKYLLAGLGMPFRKEE